MTRMDRRLLDTGGILQRITLLTFHNTDPTRVSLSTNYKTLPRPLPRVRHVHGFCARTERVATGADSKAPTGSLASGGKVDKNANNGWRVVRNSCCHDQEDTYSIRPGTDSAVFERNEQRIRRFDCLLFRHNRTAASICKAQSADGGVHRRLPRSSQLPTG